MTSVNWGFSILNDDVLEVISEYVCATVMDACALRATDTRCRRAVDTTVRRLVYEDQPELLTGTNASIRVALDINPRSNGLDLARIAFTCDAFLSIVRLVIISFALDGAKDEAHEGSECGLRPVANHHRSAASHECFWPAITASTVVAGFTVEAVLVRCLLDIRTTGNSLTDELCDAFESGLCASVKSVSFLNNFGESYQEPCDLDFHRMTRVLHAVGPQLTSLSLEEGYVDDMHAALETCSHLTRFSLMTAEGFHNTMNRLADALIASRAPLRSVSLEGLGTALSKRLIESVPTIVSVYSGELRDPTVLSPSAIDRLEKFNGISTNRQLPRIRSLLNHSWQLPSAYATAVTIDGDSELQDVDLAVLFPRATELRLGNIAVASEAVSIEDLRFPADLEVLDANRLDADVAPIFVRALAAQRPVLGNLRELRLTVLGGFFDPTPLASVFSRTLRVFDVGFSAALPAGVVSLFEAALAQLVSLEKVSARELPTARCFLAGKHTQLRKLHVASISSPGASVSVILKACPRLSLLTCNRCDTIDPPRGWVVKNFGFLPITEVFRTSFS